MNVNMINTLVVTAVYGREVSVATAASLLRRAAHLVDELEAADELDAAINREASDRFSTAAKNSRFVQTSATVRADLIDAMVALRGSGSPGSIEAFLRS